MQLLVHGWKMNYKVRGLDDPYNKTVGFEKEYEDWTEAQDKSMQLLEDGVEWVEILIKNGDGWGLLQELNLERGIVDTNFNTHSLAPYYVRLRDL